MKHRKHFIITLLVCSVIIFWTGCQDDIYDNAAKVDAETFFHHGKRDVLVANVINYLIEKNDSSEFITAFKQKYGLPEWEKAVTSENRTHILLFVPIVNHIYKDVETIWLFKITDNYIEYYPVSKRKVVQNDLWVFDYFTQEVYNRPSVNGVRYVLGKKVLSKRRLVITITYGVESFIGCEYEGNTFWTSTGWHYWTTTVFLENFDPFDYSGGGNPGVGSGDFYGGGGGSGGGGNPPTQPPTNNEENQPCHKTNEKLENTAFKDILESLREYISNESPNNKIEHGYIENINNGFVQLDPANQGHSLIFPIDKHNTVGYIHNHNTPYNIDFGNGSYQTMSFIQIFSPADLIKFLQMAHATSYNGIPTEDVYGAVVTTNGTYVLKFTGNPTDIINIPNTNELDKYYLQYLSKFKNDQEKAFLNFLKDKIPVSGIQLLKIDNYNNIINQSLNDNNQVISEECP